MPTRHAPTGTPAGGHTAGRAPSGTPDPVPPSGTVQPWHGYFRPLQRGKPWRKRGKTQVGVSREEVDLALGLAHGVPRGGRGVAGE
eukprot:scaffold20632_cov90-Isochrysis_galbana.AAC.1